MSAPLKNKFWENRKNHGRKTVYSSEELLDEAVGYFEWCEANPIIENKPMVEDGTIVNQEIEKMRAFTMAGLCFFLGIGERTWRDWRKNDDLSPVVAVVDNIIYEQKFTGAAGGVLNANIIARDLGLADKQDHSSEDGSMSPSGSTLTKDEALELLEKNDMARKDDVAT